MSDLIERLENFEKYQRDTGDEYGAEVLHQAAAELILLRRAVRQLGIERPSLAALFVALDSETNLDVLSDDARVAFRRAMDTAEPDSDVLEFIKGPEPK